MVGVVERVGEGDSGVEVGEVKRVGVKEAEAVDKGEREGKGKGVARGTSADPQAASPRLRRMTAKSGFCRR